MSNFASEVELRVQYVTARSQLTWLITERMLLRKVDAPSDDTSEWEHLKHNLLDWLACDPLAPLDILVGELTEGRGWKNPCLPLHLITHPDLLMNPHPRQVFRGLGIHLDRTLPQGSTPSECSEFFRNIDIAYRADQLSPTDEDFALCGEWETLARTIFARWQEMDLRSMNQDDQE